MGMPCYECTVLGGDGLDTCMACTCTCMYKRTVLGGDGLEVEPERADDAAAIDDTQQRHAVLARARHQRLDAQRDGRVDEAGVRVDAQHGGRAHGERRLRVPEDLARRHL